MQEVVVVVEEEEVEVVVEVAAAGRCACVWGRHAETELDGSSDLRKTDGGPSTLAEVTRATMMV